MVATNAQSRYCAARRQRDPLLDPTARADQNTILWAQGINLPALLAEIPIDLTCERFEQLPELKIRFFSFWFFGILSWYMIGRVAEDILKWRQTSLPALRRFDLLFAVEAFVLAILSFLLLVLGQSKDNVRVLTAWSAIWVVLASAALSLRLFQKARQKGTIARLDSC